jgi:hypothetical protein
VEEIIGTDSQSCKCVGLIRGWEIENFLGIPGNLSFCSDFRGFPEWVFPIQAKKRKLKKQQKKPIHFIHLIKNVIIRLQKP